MLLTGLLPAFRDLRAPLAAGYITLFAGWLALYNRIPPEATAGGALHALYGLADWGGHVGVFAVATFIAWMIGSVVQFLTEENARRRNTRHGGPTHDLEDPSTLRAYVDNVTADTPGLLEAASKEHRSGLSEEELKAAIAGQISDELPRIARRMLGDENELYDEYDRLIAEAQFREITFVPLLALMVVLAVTWSWYFLPSVLLLPPLYGQAVRERELAYKVVVDALLIGKVTAPSVERLQRLTTSAQPASSS